MNTIRGGRTLVTATTYAARIPSSLPPQTVQFQNFHTLKSSPQNLVDNPANCSLFVSANQLSTFYSSHYTCQQSHQIQKKVVPDEDIMETYRTSWSTLSSNTVDNAAGSPPPLAEASSGGGAGDSSVASDGGGDNEGKPSDIELAVMAEKLHKAVATLLVSQHDYTLYDQNIVLEDRIRNKTLNGIVEYHKVLNLVKIYLNAKYVYVKLAVDSVAVDPEEATVTIKWSVNGMGMIKAIVQYIPKQLYKRQNMDKIADQVAAGVSTYHIHNAKVVRHIVDNIEVDKDKVRLKSRVEEIKAKVAKLQPRVPNPAGAMYKKVEPEGDSKNHPKLP